MLKSSPELKKAVRGRRAAEVRVHGKGGLNTIIPASLCVAAMFLKMP
jgi:hypothetical protein